MQSYEAARKAGLIGDAIFMFPEKYGGTVWRDGPRDKNAETNVLKELLPHLEQAYGATTDREQRTIMGLSMGAAGSIFWGGKYPELFAQWWRWTQVAETAVGSDDEELHPRVS